MDHSQLDVACPPSVGVLIACGILHFSREVFSHRYGHFVAACGGAFALLCFVVGFLSFSAWRNREKTPLPVRKAECVLLKRIVFPNSDFLNGDVVALAVDGKLHVMTIDAGLYTACCQRHRDVIGRSGSRNGCRRRRCRI